MLPTGARQFPLSPLMPVTAAPAVSLRREHTSETKLMRLSPDRWLRRGRRRETGPITELTLPTSQTAWQEALNHQRASRGLCLAPLTSLAHVCTDMALNRPEGPSRHHMTTTYVCVDTDMHTHSHQFSYRIVPTGTHLRAFTL